MINVQSSPTITNVIFTDNSSILSGGGMDNSQSNPILTKVIFTHNSAQTGGGINTVQGNPTLTDVIFRENSADVGGGMSNHQSHPTLLNVTFNGNIAVSRGGGISNIQSNPNLTNVTLNNNSAERGGGMSNESGNITMSPSYPILTNVTFSGNSATTQGGGIYNFLLKPLLRNIILWGNDAPTGAQIYDLSSTPVISDSVVQDGYAGGTHIITANPLLGSSGSNGGFTETIPLQSGSSAIDAGDDVNCPSTDQRGIERPQGNHCDIGAYEYQPPGIRYVKWNATGANNGSSWVNAYTDLQSALSAASSGDEIWVASGTYKPTSGSDRTVSFVLKNGVALYGDFNGTETSRTQRDSSTNVTVLSGDIGALNDNSDNSYHVVVGSNTNSSAILDGFTITGGKTLEDISLAPENVGGGMYNKYGSPSVMNIIFIGNEAAFGGGMYNGGDALMPETEGYPSLTNVTFQNNSAFEGGGLFNENYIHATLTNVIFDGNTATRAGGGMEDRLGTLGMTNVVFNNNTGGIGGGGFQNFSLDASLTSVTFSGNSAMHGGGMANDSGNLVLTNATFTGNSAEFGGGIWNSNSDPTLTNVTISDNTASTYGGGLYNESNGNSIVRNTVLWGNVAPEGAQIYNDASLPTVNDSVVQGGYVGGTNIITTDPKLGTLGNYGGFTETIPLQVGSSAIDTGDDANCPSTDQRGVSRPQGNHCDIGAYEYEFQMSPFLIAPTDGHHEITLRPNFDWGDVSGATSYTIQISKSAAFVSGKKKKLNTIIHSATTVSSNYTPAIDLPVGSLLYWRVIANGTNRPSEWSEARSFTTANPPSAPILSFPANTALIYDYSPLLTWSQLSVPTGTAFDHYQLQLDDDANFSSPVIDTSLSSLTTTQYQVSSALPDNSTFYWRVYAFNTDGESEPLTNLLLSHCHHPTSIDCAA